ncbi:hypothetical protein RA268_28280, partial [Pseudomonas syringae pv. tagetis]
MGGWLGWGWVWGLGGLSCWRLGSFFGVVCGCGGFLRVSCLLWVLFGCLVRRGVWLGDWWGGSVFLV